MLCTIIMLLQTETSLGFHPNTLDLEATTFIDTVIPPPRSMHLTMRAMLLAALLIERTNDMPNFLATRLIHNQNSVSSFNYYQILHTHQRNKPTTGMN
ncbi:hypothetical protein A9G05_10630 [Pseudomonas sp. ENNP23]|nr:hypothetical protein A9G05_10630 [Pseudomonas sp. ENNP23]